MSIYLCKQRQLCTIIIIRLIIINRKHRAHKYKYFSSYGQICRLSEGNIYSKIIIHGFALEV